MIPPNTLKKAALSAAFVICLEFPEMPVLPLTPSVLLGGQPQPNSLPSTHINRT